MDGNISLGVQRHERGVLETRRAMQKHGDAFMELNVSTYHGGRGNPSCKYLNWNFPDGFIHIFSLPF
mgnify:CR=1 FL=1